MNRDFVITPSFDNSISAGAYGGFDTREFGAMRILPGDGAVFFVTTTGGNVCAKSGSALKTIKTTTRRIIMWAFSQSE
jgi:hypothetical protein